MSHLSAVWAGSSGDGEFFFQLLFLVETGVIAVERKQLVMPSNLHDSSAIEYRDLVGVAHS